MDAVAGRTGGKSVWDLLFGLQLGVMGGILMLIWFALISPILGRPWWLIPNLFASHFYNSREVHLGPGIVTIVGIAVQIVTSGIVGSINGLISPGGRLSGIAAASDLVRALSVVCVEKDGSADARSHDTADPVGRILPAGLGAGWHQHLVRARRVNPGRLSGAWTNSPLYFFNSSLNLAALPRRRNVRLSEA